MFWQTRRRQLASRCNNLRSVLAGPFSLCVSAPGPSMPVEVRPVREDLDLPRATLGAPKPLASRDLDEYHAVVHAERVELQHRVVAALGVGARDLEPAHALAAARADRR
jgi:hypothetical protein